MTTSARIETTTDNQGRVVGIGSRVRVMSVCDSLIADLPTDEQVRVRSMVGEVFEVYEVDSWGIAWVEKYWEESPGEINSHSLGLNPLEMALVDNNV